MVNICKHFLLKNWAANGLNHSDLQAHTQGCICLSSSSPSPQPSREATWKCDHSGAPPTFFGAGSWDVSQEGPGPSGRGGALPFHFRGKRFIFNIRTIHNSSKSLEKYNEECKHPVEFPHRVTLPEIASCTNPPATLTPMLERLDICLVLSSSP